MGTPVGSRGSPVLARLPKRLTNKLDQIGQVLRLEFLLQPFGHQGLVGCLKDFDLPSQNRLTLPAGRQQSDAAARFGFQDTTETTTIFGGDLVAEVFGINGRIGIEDRAEQRLLGFVGDRIRTEL